MSGRYDLWLIGERRSWPLHGAYVCVSVCVCVRARTRMFVYGGGGGGLVGGWVGCVGGKCGGFGGLGMGGWVGVGANMHQIRVKTPANRRNVRASSARRSRRSLAASWDDRWREGGAGGQPSTSPKVVEQQHAQRFIVIGHVAVVQL